MAFGPDLGGAQLSYVTRLVTGDVPTTKTKFKNDKNGGHNVEEQAMVEEPVIVFLPNRSVRVMSFKEAGKLGFLNQPNILNFEAVTDQTSSAGKFKFGINEAVRHQAWMDLENGLIAACLRKAGKPLPDGVHYSNESIYIAAKEAA